MRQVLFEFCVRVLSAVRVRPVCFDRCREFRQFIVTLIQDFQNQQYAQVVRRVGVFL